MFKRYKKNKGLYIFIASVGMIVFLISYTVSIAFLRSSKERGTGILGEATQASFMNMNDAVISEKSNIEFILNYKNSLDKVKINDKLDQTINVKKDDLIGLNQEQAEKIFSSFGYKIEKFTKENVVFIKDVEGYNYKEDSYFIGIKDENIVIYNKDSNGAIKVVEEKLLNPKDDGGQSYFKINDIENRGNLLRTFYEGHKDYQFSNIQEAMEYAQALCST
ncbi:hypothetical protein [Clostridium sp. UBA1056]|uniref:hypothetical protein n=1 Tax=unclassified Clostridium TaxID=2614128 RepID=UPI00321667A7